jgi:acetyl-CoA acetyltransferase
MASKGYHGSTAIASAGMTTLSRRSGRDVLALATEACRMALDAAGLSSSEVDGVASYSMYDDSVPSESVAGALGIHDLSYCMDFNQGGQSSSFMVMNAAMAIHCGQARAVLVYRALNGRSGTRVGRARASGGGTSLRYPPGLVAYPQVQALWARRYMIETSATEHDLAAAAINARTRAASNPRALRREPLTEEQYFASPYVASPYRGPDCTIEVDGACAVLVVGLERARDLKLPPAVIASSGWQSHRFDLDMASFLTYDTFSRNFGYHLRERLWGIAGMRPCDVQVASLYDCFTGVLIQNIEGFGLAEIGGGGDFIRRQAQDAALTQINPSGGLLAEGYLHGMNVLAEAVWQVQGQAGPTQVAGCEAALTCSGGAMSGSALVLTRDHGGRLA